MLPITEIASYITNTTILFILENGAIAAKALTMKTCTKKIPNDIFDMYVILSL